jgi:hypothetical protein
VEKGGRGEWGGGEKQKKKRGFLKKMGRVGKNKKIGAGGGGCKGKRWLCKWKGDIV